MSTALVDLYSYNSIDRAAAFESSTSFASIPLQPIPWNLINNSGPISSIRNRVVSVKDQDWIVGGDSKVQNHNEQLTVSSANFSSEGSLEDDESSASQNLQWAQGKAGEDRVHVVVSEEDGWVFVGIYDGFNDPCNGPDAPDYLLSNLYTAVHKELKGLIWDERLESAAVTAPATSPAQPEKPDSGRNLVSADGCAQCVVDENYPCASGDVNFDSNSKKREFRNSKTKSRGSSGRKWEDNQRRWRCEWDRERVDLDRRLKELLNFEILRWSKI